MSAACGSDEPTAIVDSVKDPATAPKVAVDRFSAAAGMLFVRTSTNGLPAPNAPIDMDTGPFVTSGLGPHGEHIKYYNFDVQPTAPAPIFVLIRDGESSPVLNQLNIVDVIPGQQGYNDFWQVMKVTVPRDYVANTVTSVGEIRARGFRVEPTTSIVNCPIVPEGSVARLRIGGGTPPLIHGWYRGQIVTYFNFDEVDLSSTTNGKVPVASIFVSFTINPDQPGGGPPSGFKTEPASLQTHNVVANLPGQPGYSPLWSVMPFNNSAFGSVHDLATAVAAPTFGVAAIVNCPVVSVQP
jgi:hypothetical protein